MSTAGRSSRRSLTVTAAAVLAAAVIGFVVFINTGYKADEHALECLGSDADVAVSETEYGWLFDGPGETDALIFYPGARVEASAYAPLLHELAAQGLDVCLVRMPLDFAFMGMDKADGVMELYSYDNWYIGGHSLGGAMAARYAASNGDALQGVILLAAYPTAPLDNDLTAVVLVGSEDTVINGESLSDGRQYYPDNVTEVTIEGGNHAQFGSYGEQRGDGAASIPAEEQVEQSVEIIIDNLR